MPARWAKLGEVEEEGGWKREMETERQKEKERE